MGLIKKFEYCLFTHRWTRINTDQKIQIQNLKSYWQLLLISIIWTKQRMSLLDSHSFKMVYPPLIPLEKREIFLILK